MSAKQEMENWVSCQTGDVKKNFKVVELDTVGNLIRIDKIVPKAFTPRLPYAIASKENNSIPRICLSTSLLGCFYGYDMERMLMDFCDGPLSKEEFDEPFKGGYYISKIKYELALLPNEKLVPGAPYTDEHWVVNFNKEHSLIKPEKIGKLFITSVEYVADSKATAPYPKVNFVVHVDCEEGLKLNRDVTLEPGYWEFTYTPGIKDGKRFTKHGLYAKDECGVMSISEGDYQNKKKSSCALLSYTQPLIAEWS